MDDQQKLATQARSGSRGHTRRSPPPPLKLEKIWFFGVKSWFFTRNTPKIITPPSTRRNFFMCAPPNLKSWIRYCRVPKTTKNKAKTQHNMSWTPPYATEQKQHKQDMNPPINNIKFYYHKNAELWYPKCRLIGRSCVTSSRTFFPDRQDTKWSL